MQKAQVDHSEAINKSSPVPRYYQLAEWIRGQIQGGELKPGEQLPSERELSERSGVSRMTIRQALARLARDGTVVVEHGVGTFVAEPKLAYDTLHLLGFTEEMIRLGGGVESRVLAQVLVREPVNVDEALHLEAREKVIKMVRLRLSEATPLVLETIYVSARQCPALERKDLGAQSLYAIMEHQYRLRLKFARQTIEAVTADEFQSELFGVEPGAPMILLEGVTYSDRDAPVEAFKVLYRGDRFKFELESWRETAHATSAMPKVSMLMI
ncbi:GntR family transcriptional regulator [soil metagenome]